MLLVPISSHAQDNPVFVGSGVEFMPQYYSDEIVKNSPVTARITTRSVQQLYDGKRIVQGDVTDLNRDSWGRVRRENSSGKARSHSMFSLSDPGQEHTFMLDKENKIAFKLPELSDLIGFESTSFEAVQIASFGNVGDMSNGAVEVLIGSDIAVVGDGTYDDPVVITEDMDSMHTHSGSFVAVPQGTEDAFAGSLEMIGPAWPSAGQTEVKPLGQTTVGDVRLEGTS